MKFYVPLVLSLLLWGSAFPGIRAGLRGYDPLPMTLFRFLIASLTMGLLALINGIKLPRKQDLPLFFAIAFFSIPGYHVCLNVGERFVTASSASLILSTLPIWTVMWSRLFLKEPFPPLAWGGAVLSFMGAALIGFGEGGGFQLNVYVLLILFSALCGSVYTTIQKKLIANYDPISFNCFVIWIGTAYLLPFTPKLPAAITQAPLPATLAVIYLGIFPAALTFVLWSMVVKQIPASRAVTFLFLIPVVATVIGWVWLGETPSALSLTGGGIILAGLALTTYASRR